MTSAGGLRPGRPRPPSCRSSLLLSGPAGGVRAAAAVAAASGFPDAVTFDMGGTSTDVCLVLGGVPEPAGRAVGRRLPGPAAVARHPHHRRRRRLDRPARRRRRAASSGPQSAGAEPGPGLLRARRDRADGHRRRPRRRPHPRRRRVRRARRLDVDAAGARARPGGRRPPRASSRSSTRRWSRRCGRCRSSGASTRGPRARRVRRRRAAARLRAGRGARAWPRSIVPAARRRAVGRRAAGRAPSARPRPVVADAARSRAASTTRCEARRRGAAVGRGRWRRATVDDGGRLPLRGPEPRAHACAPVDDFARGAPAPQRLRPAGHAGRGRRRSGPRARPPVADRRSTIAARTECGRRSPGPAVVAEPDCTIWVPDGWRGRARRGRRARPRTREAGVSLRSGRPLQVLISRLDRRRRRDGRGAAARRVQPEHQGAGRLLGRAVHGRRRAARAGRAHPRAPRLDAGVGARRPSTPSATACGPATR